MGAPAIICEPMPRLRPHFLDSFRRTLIIQTTNKVFKVELGSFLLRPEDDAVPALFNDKFRTWLPAMSCAEEFFGMTT
jgi:hypothetical protein